MAGVPEISHAAAEAAAKTAAVVGSGLGAAAAEAASSLQGGIGALSAEAANKLAAPPAPTVSPTDLIDEASPAAGIGGPLAIAERFSNGEVTGAQMAANAQAAPASPAFGYDEVDTEELSAGIGTGTGTSDNGKYRWSRHGGARRPGEGVSDGFDTHTIDGMSTAELRRFVKTSSSAPQTGYAQSVLDGRTGATGRNSSVQGSSVDNQANGSGGAGQGPGPAAGDGRVVSTVTWDRQEAFDTVQGLADGDPAAVDAVNPGSRANFDRHVGAERARQSSARPPGEPAGTSANADQGAGAGGTGGPGENTGSAADNGSSGGKTYRWGSGGSSYSTTMGNVDAGSTVTVDDGVTESSGPASSGPAATAAADGGHPSSGDGTPSGATISGETIAFGAGATVEAGGRVYTADETGVARAPREPGSDSGPATDPGAPSGGPAGPDSGAGANNTTVGPEGTSGRAADADRRTGTADPDASSGGPAADAPPEAGTIDTSNARVTDSQRDALAAMRAAREERDLEVNKEREATWQETYERYKAEHPTRPVSDAGLHPAVSVELHEQFVAAERRNEQRARAAADAALDAEKPGSVAAYDLYGEYPDTIPGVNAYRDTNTKVALGLLNSTGTVIDVEGLDRWAAEHPQKAVLYADTLVVRRDELVREAQRRARSLGEEFVDPRDAASAAGELYPPQSTTVNADPGSSAADAQAQYPPRAEGTNPGPDARTADGSAATEQADPEAELAALNARFADMLGRTPDEQQEFTNRLQAAVNETRAAQVNWAHVGETGGDRDVNITTAERRLRAAYTAQQNALLDAFVGTHNPADVRDRLAANPNLRGLLHELIPNFDAETPSGEDASAPDTEGSASGPAAGGPDSRRGGTRYAHNGGPGPTYGPNESDGGTSANGGGPYDYFNGTDTGSPGWPDSSQAGGPFGYGGGEAGPTVGPYGPTFGGPTYDNGANPRGGPDGANAPAGGTPSVDGWGPDNPVFDYNGPIPTAGPTEPNPLFDTDPSVGGWDTAGGAPGDGTDGAPGGGDTPDPDAGPRRPLTLAEEIKRIEALFFERHAASGGGARTVTTWRWNKWDPLKPAKLTGNPKGNHQYSHNNHPVEDTMNITTQLRGLKGQRDKLEKAIKGAKGDARKQMRTQLTSVYKEISRLSRERFKATPGLAIVLTIFEAAEEIAREVEQVGKKIIE